MKPYLDLAWPYGLVLVPIAGASLFFGADTPLASYFFSGLILLIGAATIGFATRGALPPAAFICLALFCLFLAIDFLRGDLVGALSAWMCLAAAGAVFLCGRAASLKSERIAPMWSLVTLGFLGLALWAFADFVINPDTIHGTPRPYHLGRLSAAFLSANTAATLFGTGLLVAATGLIKAFERVGTFQPVDLVEGLFRHGAISLVTFLFCGICLVLTASRAGIVFAALACGLLFSWQALASRRRRKTGQGIALRWIGIGALLVAGGLAAAFWSLSGDLASERYGELGADSGTRLTMFRAYAAAWLAEPWFGAGLNGFTAVNNRIMSADNATALTGVGAAHNIVLQWLIQKGLAGTLTMAAIIGVILLRIWQGLTHRRRYRPYLRGVLAIALFVLLHGMVDYALEIPGFMWWWALILGLGAGIAAGRRQIG